MNTNVLKYRQIISLFACSIFLSLSALAQPSEDPDKPWKISYVEFKQQFGKTSEDILLIDYFETKQKRGVNYVLGGVAGNVIASVITTLTAEPISSSQGVTISFSPLGMVFSLGALALTGGGIITIVNHPKEDLYLYLTGQKEIPEKLQKKLAKFAAKGE